MVTIRTVIAPVIPGAQRRALTLTGPAELLGALTSAGVADVDAQAATQAAQVQLGGGSGELRVTLMLSPAGSGLVLSRLEARHDNGAGAIVNRQPDGRYMATAAGADLVTQVKVVRGQMDVNSFYSSAVAAGVNDDLIPGFAQAFAYDFDFQREIKPGDVFEAVFEQQADPAGEAVGAGKLLFASLETQAKSKALYWYAAPSKPGGWFDSNGRSVIRSLMRTPVEGARISSPFGLRMHPVLGFMKMHNGTDFAAPVGTPIYAAGDGIVEFSGMKGPNGNFTKVLHPNGWETLYLHQSLILPNVIAGAHVSQSQEIGLVGATGVDSAGHSTVTGPHLHYEVHIDNTPVDPMSIAVGEGQALGADLAGFTSSATGSTVNGGGDAWRRAMFYVRSTSFVAVLLGQWASRVLAHELAQAPLGGDLEHDAASVAEVVRHANFVIFRESTERQNHMGSTVVALLVRGERFAAVWAGDSRLYLRRDGVLNQVTIDHTQVQQLVTAGYLTQREAAEHPMSHVLARAVGTQAEVETEALVGDVRAGDLFLLCSDGLPRVLEDHEIANELESGNPSEMVRRLIELALDRGAPDNVTAMAIGCVDPSAGHGRAPTAPDLRRRGATMRRRRRTWPLLLKQNSPQSRRLRRLPAAAVVRRR